MAVPYIDVSTIGTVKHPENPRGPLGGLGPLPTEHTYVQRDSDLARFDFGLTDEHVRALLEELEAKQIAVVVAGTGTGKSTFLPFRLLSPPPGADLRLADRGPIIVTEPRRAAAVETAKFVAEQLYGGPWGAGSEIGYRVHGSPAFDSACRLLYVTDGSLINWIRAGQLDQFGAVIIDEAHERNKNIDFILGYLRSALPRHPQLRVIVASATIDAEFFVEFFGGTEKVARLEVEALKTWGYGEPLWPGASVESLLLAERAKDWAGRGPDGTSLREATRALAGLRVLKEGVDPGPQHSSWRARMPKLVAEQIVSIVRGTDSGDVLAFLPGRSAIEEAIGAVERELGETIDVYGLMRTTPEDVQERARGPKADPTRRRVVIATNIAETSLTIDGVTFVVDSGLITQSRWDVGTASKSLPAVPHSRQGVRQRWGRVGRKAPGWVFPLYSETQYESVLPEFTPPESVRDDLEQFVLHAATSGVVNPSTFSWPGAVDRGDGASAAFAAEMQRATAALTQRGALDQDGDATPLGLELQAFNGTMAEGIALLLADQFACAVEMATALALLQTRAPVVGGLLRFDRRGWSAERRDAARLTHEATRIGCVDDLDLVLKVYSGWEGAAANPDLGDSVEERQQAWCAAHLVSHAELRAARETRRGTLEQLSPATKTSEVRRVRPELAERVRLVLTRALPDLIVERREEMGGQWQFRSASIQQNGLTLDPLATLEPRDHAFIAFRRVTRKVGHEFSNVVRCADWAGEDGQELTGWTSLALQAAPYLRAAVGRRGALSSDIHWSLLDSFLAGDVVACNVVREGGENLIAVREVRSRGTSMFVSEGAADRRSATRAALGPRVEASGVDVRRPPEIFATSGAVIDREQEPQFLASEDLDAAPDGDLDDDAMEPTPEPRGGSQSAFAKTLTLPRSGFDPMDGLATFRILGFYGLGEERRVVVDPIVAPEPEDLPFPGEELTLRVEEIVEGWGAPYVVARDVVTGFRAVIDNEDLSLVERERFVTSSLVTGAEFVATAFDWDLDSQAIEVSRLPNLVGEWSQLPRISRRQGPRTVQAVRAVVEGEPDGNGFVPVVVQSHRSGVPIARFLVRVEHLPDHASDYPDFAGMRVLLTAVPRNKRSPLSVAAYLADGRVDHRKLEDACRAIDEVDWVPGTTEVKQVRNPISTRTRDLLARLSSDPSWLRHVWMWWGRSNRLERPRVYRDYAPDDSYGAQDPVASPSVLAVGESLSGVVAAITGEGVRIDLVEWSLSGVVPGHEFPGDPHNFLSIGDKINVQITSISGGDVDLSINDVHQNSMQGALMAARIKLAPPLPGVGATMDRLDTREPTEWVREARVESQPHAPSRLEQWLEKARAARDDPPDGSGNDSELASKPSAAVRERSDIDSPSEPDQELADGVPTVAAHVQGGGIGILPQSPAVPPPPTRSPGRSRRPIPRETRAAIVDELRTGNFISRRDLARRYGVSASTVQRIAREGATLLRAPTGRDGPTTPSGPAREVDALGRRTTAHPEALPAWQEQEVQPRSRSVPGATALREPVSDPVYRTGLALGQLVWSLAFGAVLALSILLLAQMAMDWWDTRGEPTAAAEESHSTEGASTPITPGRPDPTASPATPEPTARSVAGGPRYIANTGGIGVKWRTDCTKDSPARPGGIPEGAQVTLRAVGEGRCAGWSIVDFAKWSAWVSDQYLSVGAPSR